MRYESEMAISNFQQQKINLKKIKFNHLFMIVIFYKQSE